jgi:hypothetical protein
MGKKVGRKFETKQYTSGIDQIHSTDCNLQYARISKNLSQSTHPLS